MAGGDELLAQLAVVLDDAVEDDRELVRVAGGERMRIRFGDTAVGCPARMAEARRREGAVGAGGRDQVVEGADRARVPQPRLLEERDAGGVVAAVLEALQPLQQQWHRRPVADISDDSAHPGASFCSGSTNGKARLSDTSPRVGTGQPSSRRTRDAMLAQASSASEGFSASASTRITGSVPDGRTSTRPRPRHSSFTRSTSATIAGVSSLSATRTFSFTCGKRGITAATSLSGRRFRAPHSRSPDASPSPVT